MKLIPFETGEEPLFDGCMTVSELATALQGLAIIEMVVTSSDGQVKIVVCLERERDRLCDALPLEEFVTRPWNSGIFYADSQLRRVGLHLFNPVTLTNNELRLAKLHVGADARLRREIDYLLSLNCARVLTQIPGISTSTIRHAYLVSIRTAFRHWLAESSAFFLRFSFFPPVSRSLRSVGKMAMRRTFAEQRWTVHYLEHAPDDAQKAWHISLIALHNRWRRKKKLADLEPFTCA